MSITDICSGQGGEFSANGASVALKMARTSSFNASAEVEAAITPRVISLGLLRNGCPVQPPLEAALYAGSKNGEASVFYGSTSVQADGYFFCVDLSDRPQTRKDEPKYFDTPPLLQWTFNISTGSGTVNNVVNTTPNKIIAYAAGGNNLSNSTDIRKWRAIGSSVWTRRYRFLLANPMMTVDTRISQLAFQLLL